MADEPLLTRASEVPHGRGSTATLGIDLASQAPRTAVAVVEWPSGRPPRLLELAVGADSTGTALHDKWLFTTAIGLRGRADWPSITKVGIDAPVGWPAPFVDALAMHATAPDWPGLADEDRGLFHRRLTDLVVRDRTGVTPLAVSVDKIGYCAVLLREIARMNAPEQVRRDGTALVCEVYPDPALRTWTAGSPVALAPRVSYKGPGNVARRRAIWSWLRDQLALKNPAARPPRGLDPPARRPAARAEWTSRA